MADTKISALTAASTPLAGTEVLPIVQSAATVKVAVSDLTAGRAISALGVTISGLTGSTALALNASKEIVSLTQPAFSASLSGNQIVSAGTNTKLTFDTEQFDTNSNYDNATNYRFTPTVAGYYQINVALDLADVFTGTQDVLLKLYKNGAQYLAPIRRQTGAGNEVGITLPQLVSMNGASDYLEVYLQVVSATNCNVYAGSNFSGSLARGA